MTDDTKPGGGGAVAAQPAAGGASDGQITPADWLPLALMVLGLLGAAFSMGLFLWRDEDAKPVFLLGVATGVGMLGIGAVWFAFNRRTRTEGQRQQALDAQIATLRRTGNRAEATWDVGRLKLQGYLDSNLDQVRAIFWLAVGVMLVGFMLIAGGVAQLLAGGTNRLDPALLSAGSGVLVEFIGASLMVIYRSTMTQAHDYMKVLERITAVGMSVQVLNKIADDPALKNEALVNVADKLLTMYANSAAHAVDREAPIAAVPPVPTDDTPVG